MVWLFQVPERVWCLLRGHDPLLEHGDWVCCRCRRVLGHSVLFRER